MKATSDLVKPELWFPFEKNLPLGIEIGLLACYFGGYPTSLSWLVQKIVSKLISDFFPKNQNFPRFYPFLKFPDFFQINSQKPRKHSHFNPQRQFPLKNESNKNPNLPSFPDALSCYQQTYTPGQPSYFSNNNLPRVTCPPTANSW
jgi:hypothetical protein